MEKYIGIVDGNKELIFEEQSDGYFTCERNNMKLTKFQIIHDLELGCIKLYEQWTSILEQNKERL